MSLKKNQSNDSGDTYGRSSMVMFVLSFIGVLIFFGYVIVINPGGIDTGLYEVPLQFSKAQADAEVNSWKELSADNLAYGAQLYKVNCTFCHTKDGKDMIIQRVESGDLKYGKTPLEIYRVVRKGFDGGHRFDFIPEKEKWAMISFMRSKMQNPPDDSASAWNAFLKKGMY